MAMIVNASRNNAKQQQQTPDLEPGQDFEANISTALEISAYDLEVLKRHLIVNKWVPTSIDENAFKDAVYGFRKSCVGVKLFSWSAPRLNKLFKAWNDERVEAWERENGALTARAVFELQLRRETAKYNAVRALIAYLATRQKREREDKAKNH